ncbi:MAG: ATP-binding protein [Firmicutes bacterium]|jgi:predicted AAA+ superfamily ATPase|nr:ATP-binding protein [Bacillota bacterium]
MLVKRTLEKTVRNISETFYVLLLTGPRQVGKTTLLQNLAKEDRKIVSLDNIVIRELAKRDPELFLQRYSPPVMIDEIQYAPELLPYIKAIVDQRQIYGDFWLTGSQMFLMMKNVSETLAGRVGIIPMLGLANSEIQGNLFDEFSLEPQILTQRLKKADAMNVSEIFDRIFKGSMPRLYRGDEVNLNIFFDSYINTYISRDIRDLDQVGDILSFFNFLKVVAARTSTNVNYDALARETGVSAPTAKRWLSVLVASGLVLLVEPYSNNALTRVVKAPRMYFLDTGLCAYLQGWSSSQVLENSAMAGAFFETWVVGEIYKSFLNVGKRPPLYFYRDSNQKEIDLIIYQDGVVHPIEIKKGTTPQNAAKNFSVLAPIESTNDEPGSFTVKIGNGAVICLASDLVPIDKKNWLVPAWLI